MSQTKSIDTTKDFHARRFVFVPFSPQSVLPVIVPFPLNEQPAHTEQSLTITCTISDGDLPLTLFWTFNNQPITPDMDVSILKLGKRTSVLNIDSVTAAHAGYYECWSKNAAGSASYSTELKVIGVLFFRASISLYSDELSHLLVVFFL